MWRYSFNLRSLYETPSYPEDAPEIDAAGARKVIGKAGSEGRVLLTEAESSRVLAAYGIPVAETRVAGSELTLGSRVDPQFGPVILFSAGGECALGLPPLNTTLARRLMEQTRIYRALPDPDALEQLVVRFSQLVTEQRWIQEIDINPRDARIVLLGEDVAEAGTTFKVLKGLVDEFGTSRIVDTPISEPGFTGLGVGAAMTGLRPIVDIMFGDFLALVMDQVVNQAAKVHYMSGGAWKVPMVIRATMGATRRSAAQHSQSLHAWPSHVPGLKVAIPSTPYDAKGLLKTAIRDDNPVVFFEDKISYTKVKGPVPEGDYTIPFGLADIKREGRDITLVGTSSMVQVALGAAAMLEEIGVSAEVVDPRTTWPLDEKTLIESAKKTSRAIVIDEGSFRYGVTGEIASVIAEGAFYDLDGPVRRIGAMHVPIPFSPPLEDATVPTERDVFEMARRMCNK
jgi:pyruvate dehydrogenase E1 component beta subunit